MSVQPCVYLFKRVLFGHGGESVVCAAAQAMVVERFGGGELKGTGGLDRAFGGHMVFRSNEAGALFLGVWGARNASRFRRALRETFPALTIAREPPPARLVFYGTALERPGAAAIPAWKPAS